jgi:hypothetical protein
MPAQKSPKPAPRNPAFLVHNCLTAMAHDLLIDVYLRGGGPPLRTKFARWETDEKLLDPDAKKKDRGSTAIFFDADGTRYEVNRIERIARVGVRGSRAAATAR